MYLNKSLKWMVMLASLAMLVLSACTTASSEPATMQEAVTENEPTQAELEAKIEEIVWAYEEAYEKGELPHGIILVGYSLGGCGAIRVSKILQEDDIPVKLLFLIETVNPFQKVPANVEECFNLYHFPALLGHAVKAESEETKLTNCEAYTDAGFGLEYSHFVLPFVDEVHELIARELVGAIQEQPLGEEAPNKLRMNP